MAYEYEHRNIKANVYSGLATNESVEELQEVYGKAKAWDTLKELLMKEYPEVAHLAHVSNGEGERGEISKHGEVLEHMDKLDGTNEFSNLLSDMEDE
ncbi:hypothetical protein EKQ61_03255 [Staphylococcus gallinarum]|uniref:Phage protein n=1 Tax=Staphylococcus gallinarum TaxID=1293 RepID=A0A380FI14_STAGA|nr:hypothetical protein [Staphylococcus gallinarum]RTX81499.1 hypothetical protein EKQ61_03255 [Staphylococcus gallinarum]GEQ05532.1 hypothetical protein SGA02_13600 [Staphylococcus gallinarum]SUM33788.1 Uncharacterised protein [Staphylococcus gallinarum]